MSKDIVKRGTKKAFPSIFRLIEKTDQDLKEIKSAINDVNSRLDNITKIIDSHDSRLDDLKRKAKKVEPYQEIYGVDGIFKDTSRESKKRAELIYADLDNDLGGVRFLDVGSSLGYVTFFLSDRGAIAEGWDNNSDNIAVSQAARKINGIEASFLHKELNLETVRSIPPNNFDAVVVLNVFHHIIRFQGIDETKEIVKELLEKTPVMYAELARKDEDKSLPWNDSQPKDELEIFKGLDVKIQKLGEFPNHLSKKKRPLYKITRASVRVNKRRYGVKKISFKSFKNTSAATGDTVRRFYSGDEYFVKRYETKPPLSDNQEQIVNELNFFLKARDWKIGGVPELVDYEFGEADCTLVLKRLSGSLADSLDLSAAGVEKLALESSRVFSELEKRGLFHNDIRSWNIFTGDKKTFVIDFGLVSNEELEDNIIAYTWMLSACMTGTREPLEQFKTKLPNQDDFRESSKLSELYKLIEAGSISNFSEIESYLAK